jgi:ADP-ribose pyrophosphatase YjhB (NUDIX family)
MGRQYPTFEEYLKAEYKGPFMATDCIVEYGDGVVLIERLNEPYGLALIGGIAEDMTFAQNAIKESKEEVGLSTVEIKNPDQPFRVYSALDHDPRAHISTCVFIGTGYGMVQAGDDAKEAFVVPINILERFAEASKWAIPNHKKAIIDYCHQKVGFAERFAKSFFISGHGDLTEEEFDEHYVKAIDGALVNDRASFVVGDFRGADTMAQDYLKRKTDRVTVFHMFEEPRYNAGFPSFGRNYRSDSERDRAMTKMSDEDIAWVRPGKERSGTARNLSRQRP